MSRLLMLVAIAALVYLLIKSYRKGAPRQDRAKADVEDMVCCAQCGMHLPRSESTQAQGKFFCGAAHRDAYLK